MKTLNDYTQDKITNLLTKYGGFFAFSDKQVKENGIEGVDYVNCGSGLIAPRNNAKKLMIEIIKVGDEGIKQDLAENGIEAIIKRELSNYEAYYTGEIYDTVDALKDYGITRKQVKEVFNRKFEKSIY